MYTNIKTPELDLCWGNPTEEIIKDRIETIERLIDVMKRTEKMSEVIGEGVEINNLTYRDGYKTAIYCIENKLNTAKIMHTIKGE